MKTLPTAKEFWDSTCITHPDKSPGDIMIEFAKIHVQAALEAAVQKYTHDETHVSDNPAYLEQSILNAYPLENIK